MEQQLTQLMQYVQQMLAQGHTPDAIKQSLLQSNWPEPVVVEAYRRLGLTQMPLMTDQPAPAKHPDHAKRVRTGILWIASPFIILMAVAVMQVLVRAIGVDSGTAVHKIFQIISVLAGIFSVVLIPVGLVVGIIKISKA